MSNSTPTTAATQPSSKLEQALAAYQCHAEDIHSVIIGSVDAQGLPLASYAPYIMDEQKCIYALLSGMSMHSSNLESTGKASVLLIEDESKAKNLFARKRLTFNCSISIIDAQNTKFSGIIEALQHRHGKIITQLSELPDFRLFAFTPKDARFVIGFGAAYDVYGEKFNQLKIVEAGPNPHGQLNQVHAGKGHGHDERSSSRLPAMPRGELSESMKKMIISHMNDNHSDSLLNIATVYAKLDEVQSATLTSIDVMGMDLHVICSSKTMATRIDFDTPLSDANKAHSTLVNMSMHAKQVLQQ